MHNVWSVNKYEVMHELILILKPTRVIYTQTQTRNMNERMMI